MSQREGGCWMKIKRILISSIITLFILCDSIFACTVVVQGIRKEFRRSSQVLVGEFMTFDDREVKDVPEWLADKWKPYGPLANATFRIKRSWKGQRTGQITLYVSPLCDCPMRQLFPNPDEEILVFADKDGVVDSCNFFVIEKSNDRRTDDLEKTIKTLDSFWFRTWARIYPF